MPGFTVKNLMEIDDAAADSSEIEARFARKHLDSEHLGVSYFRYAPRFRPGIVEGDGAPAPNFWTD